MADRKIPTVDQNIQITEPVDLNSITEDGTLDFNAFDTFELSTPLPDVEPKKLASVSSIRRVSDVSDALKNQPSREEILEAAAALEGMEDSLEKKASIGRIDFTEDLRQSYFNVDRYDGKADKVELIQDSNFQQIVEKLFDSSNKVVYQNGPSDEQIVALRLPPSDSELFDQLNRTPLNTTQAEVVNFDSKSMLVIDATGKAALFNEIDDRILFQSPNPHIVANQSTPELDSTPDRKPAADARKNELELLKKELEALKEEELAERRQQELDSGANKDKGKQAAEQAGRLTLFNFGNKNPNDSKVALRRQSRVMALNDEIRSLQQREGELSQNLRADTERSRLQALKDKFIKTFNRRQAPVGLSKAEDRFVRKTARNPDSQVAFMGLISDRAQQLINELNTLQSLSGKPEAESLMRSSSDRIDKLLNGKDGIARQYETFKAMDIGKNIGNLKGVPGASEAFEELSMALTSLRRHPMASKHAVGGKVLSEMPVFKQMSDMVNGLKASFAEALESVKGLWTKRER